MSTLLPKALSITFFAEEKEKKKKKTKQIESIMCTHTHTHTDFFSNNNLYSLGESIVELFL